MYRHFFVKRTKHCFGLLKACRLRKLQDTLKFCVRAKHNKYFQIHNHLTCCHWHYLRNVLYTPFLCMQHRMLHTPPMRNEMYVRVNEVFNDYHSKLMNGGFAPESIVTFTGKLHSAMYTDLGWLPWLHVENHIIAYMQILMNNQRNSLLREMLYKHRHFEAIYNIIFRNLDKIPAEHCPSILLSLLHCGLDQADPIVIVLLTKCYDFIPTADIPSLCKLAYTVHGLDGRNLLLAGKIVERLDKILKNIEDKDVAIDDLCNTVPIMAGYMSSDLLKACVKVVLRKMNSSSNLSINTVGTCLRFSCKMSFRTSKNLLQEIRLAARKTLDEFEDFDLLESHHIAEVCHNAKRLGCFSGDLVTKMQIRSLDLLRGNLRPLHIRHITNLLFAFTQNTSSDIKKEITELLIKNIDDADVLILSNLADCIIELELCDPELMALFHWNILQNIDNIAKYITRLVKVLRLLKDRQQLDAVFNQKIAEVLLKLLSSRQRFDSTFVIFTASFVLPTVRTLIPNMLMECLGTILPRCNLSHTLLILSGLEKMKGPWLRSLHNQVLQIRANIQENIRGKIDSATQANQLAHLIKCLHIKSQKKDFVLLDQIMSHYPRLTKAMTRHDYLKTVQTFKRLLHPYYHPEVFEDLIQYMKENLPEVGFTGVLDLVTLLANAGYRPQDFDSFADFTIRILTDAMKAENYIGQVFLAHYLSIMQIFPDDVLGQIFTFDFLEEIDGIIEVEPDQQLFLKNIMMQLNRSVILECPHLDVPWFHQHYCQDQEEKSRIRDFPRIWPFVEEAENIVQEVVGGSQYVQKNVYSPYFHPINFEVVLDADGKPVTKSAVQQAHSNDMQYERVAFQLILNQQLCSNSQHRRGIYTRDRRHLEILGYRVEEVSRYEWNSMALYDWTSRVDFVRSKIFRSEQKGHSGELFSRLESSPSQN